MVKLRCEGSTRQKPRRAAIYRVMRTRHAPAFAFAVEARAPARRNLDMVRGAAQPTRGDKELAPALVGIAYPASPKRRWAVEHAREP